MFGSANPQRLTPFEHFMLADDRVEYPMDFLLRFGFQGQLNRECLVAALDDVSARHPLLTSTIQREGGSWVWKANTAAPRLRDLGTTGGSSAIRFPKLDASRESGLQVWLANRDDACDLWLQVHHSCSDAVGILLFCNEWLRHYEQLESNGSRQEANKALGSPAERIWAERFSAPKLSPWRYLSPSRQERHRLLSFALNRPRRIQMPAGTAPAPGLAVARPGVASARIDLTRETWQAAKARLPVAASINDVLLAGLFCVLRQWNDEVTGEKERYCLRIAMPMDLRSETGRKSPAMNNVSIVFIDREASEISSDHEFLAGLQRETNWVKKNHGAFVLHDVLHTLQPLPGGMESLVAPITCTTSSALSNLGELASFLPHEGDFRLGDARLVDLDFLPPNRPGTLATLGVVTYAGKLHISMRYDGRRVSPVLAENLLGRIVAQWSETLAADSCS